MAQKPKKTTNNFGIPIDNQARQEVAHKDLDVALTQLAEAFSVGANAGLSMQDMRAKLTDKQRNFLDSQISSGAPSIQLPLGVDFQLITFTLHEFSYEDIESKTTIHACNARQLEFFSEFDKLKAVEMLKLTDEQDNEIHVNTTPALACRYPDREDSRAHVFDGLRRRFGCLGAKCSYKVYITDEPMTDFHAKLASSKNNDTLGNGFLDRRADVLQQIDDINKQRANDEQEPLSERQLSELLNINRNLIKSYRDSVVVPNSLFSAFPSPTSLGRPTVNRIVKLFNDGGALVSKESQDEAIEALNVYVSSMDTSISSDKANSEALKVLNLHCLKIKPKSPLSPPKAFSHGSIVVSDNGNVRIDMDEVSEESIEALISQLRALSTGKLKN